MNRRYLISTFFAGAHLILVGCGAAGVAWPPDFGIAGRVLSSYGALSGASNDYGFYAPAVGTELRTVFTWTDGAGRSRVDALAEGSTHEANLRLGSIASMFVSEEWRPGLGLAWAAAVFGRHPEARTVTLRVEEYDVPAMAGYRAGARPRWRLLSESTFERIGEGHAGEEATSG